MAYSQLASDEGNSCTVRTQLSTGNGLEGITTIIVKEKINALWLYNFFQFADADFVAQSCKFLINVCILILKNVNKLVNFSIFFLDQFVSWICNPMR